MKTYKARVYATDGYVFNEVFLAEDYWDAVRRLESRYPGLRYNSPSEA